MKRPSLLLLLLLYCASLHSAHAAVERNAEGRCDLECWLANLTFSVPTLPVVRDGINLTISDLTCRGIELADVNGSFIPPLSVDVWASGVGTACTADWSYMVVDLPFIHGSGTVAISVGGGSGADFGMRLVQDPVDGLATAAVVSKCTLTVDVTHLSFTGGLTGKFLELFEKEISSVITAGVNTEGCKAIRPLVEHNLTKVLADIDAEVRPFLRPVPPAPAPSLPPDCCIDLRSSALGALDWVLDTIVGPNGDLGLNVIVNHLTGGTGRLVVDSSSNAKLLPFMQQSLRLSSLNATITLGVTELVLAGLNTWSDPFKVGIPIGPHTIENIFGLDKFDANITFYVKVLFDGSDGPVHDRELDERGFLAFQVSNAGLTNQVQVGVGKANLNRVMQNPGLLASNPVCALGVLDSAFVTLAQINASVDSIALTALGGSLEKGLDQAIDSILLLFVTSFRRAIPAFFTRIADGVGREELNSFLLKQIAAASDSSECGASFGDAASSSLVFNANASAIAASSAGFLFLLLLALVIVLRRMEHLDKGETTDDKKMPSDEVLRKDANIESDRDDQNEFIARQIFIGEGTPNTMRQLAIGPSSVSSYGELIQESSMHRKKSIPSKQPTESTNLLEKNALPDESAGRCSDMCLPVGQASLVNHSGLPWMVRLGVPLLLLLNIAAFISANFGVGASVFVKLNIGDSDVLLPSLFDFTLANSIRDMWHAGVIPLSLLIAVFSGAWPYVKLLLMLVCWLIPVRFLKTNVREIFLMWLDALGKWSLIDSFVLVLMMCAFRMHIEIPIDQESSDTSSGSAPAGQKGELPVSVDVFVQPMYAFYCFLLATMLSLAMTHIILGFHRKTAGARRKSKLQHTNQPNRVVEKKCEALSSHSFHFANFTVSFTSLGIIMIVLLLVVSIVMVVIGIAVPSYIFHFKGAVGLALQVLGEPTRIPHSLWGTGTLIPDASIDPESIGVRWIQVTYFVFAIAAPIVHMVSLLVLWIIPLRYKIQKSIFFATEILNAWSALEVFVVSIMAALLELEQFTQFIVGDRCNMINPILERYFDVVLNGDDKCFDVIATLDKGCWLLFSAVIVYIACGTLVMKMCHMAMAEHGGEQLENTPSEQPSRFFRIAAKLRLVRIGPALDQVSSVN